MALESFLTYNSKMITYFVQLDSLFICKYMKFFPGANVKIYIMLLILLYIANAFYNGLNVSVRIDFVIITIYFISIVRPMSLNLGLIGVVGLFADKALFLPLGTSMLSYVFAAAVVRANSGSLFKQRFYVVWTWFGVCLVCIAFAKWGVALFYGRSYQYQDFFDLVVTFLMYPLLHGIYCEYIIYEYKRR